MDFDRCLDYVVLEHLAQTLLTSWDLRLSTLQVSATNFINLAQSTPEEIICNLSITLSSHAKVEESSLQDECGKPCFLKNSVQNILQNSRNASFHICMQSQS